jgi:hypothetical protein
MLERHWPWLVSIAVPALAAVLLVAWFAVAPRGLESSMSAALDDGSAFHAGDRSRGLDLRQPMGAANAEPRQIALFKQLDLNADGVISADEFRQQLMALTELD